MPSLRRVFVVLAAGLGVLGAAAGGGLVWAGSTSAAILDQTYEVHRAEFPIPTPLGEAEVAALRAERTPPGDPPAPPADPSAPPADPLAGVDLGALALERAVARGDHLIHTRYACVECHGKNLGGGTMIDDPALGTLLGPNLTTGKGSVVTSYTAADWDRKVRHGVNPKGRSGPMPSQDYIAMTDQELADIVSYIRSVPPVDNVVPPPSLGPVGKVLIATGQLKPAALEIEHRDTHAAFPPEATASAAFGQHILQVCVGCHRADLSGGPILGGDPNWLPARNLTPHADGLQGWTEAQFIKLMREGVRPDGSKVGVPMNLIVPYTANSTDVELQATWLALQALPPKPTGS